MTTKKRKIALRIGIPLGILVIILLAVSLPYFFRVQSEISKMTPIDSKEVATNVYSIKANSYVNFYIVKNESSLIAFDSGQNPNNIKNEMAKLNLNLSNVEAVFLTHTDSDHVGGLKLFPFAKVYLAAEEEQMINGQTSKSFLVNNKISSPYSLLSDNQIIETSGLKVRCILTPGHTPGSMSYVVNDLYLFPGDTLSLKNNRVDLFNDFFNMNTNQERDSITKLSKLSGVQYIFTTHYGFSDNYQESFAKWNDNMQ